MLHSLIDKTLLLSSSYEWTCSSVVEQWPLKPLAVGSNPTGSTIPYKGNFLMRNFPTLAEKRLLPSTIIYMSTRVYRPHIFDCESKDILYKSVENMMVDMIIEATGKQGHARLALAGGSTPMPLYTMLGNNPALPWNEVEMYQVDERFISADDPASNQYRIREAFGDTPIDRLKHFHPWKVDLPLDECVSNYQSVLDTLEDPFFDVTVLGIGPDGHIGSLFPQADYLKHQDELVLATTTDTFEVHQRVTMTIETILNSEHIIVLLVGKNKEPILQELNGGDKSAVDYPAKFLLAHPNVQVFYTAT